MSRLDYLPPDQRAALSLLLRQRKSYAQVAALLNIPEHTVHERAHTALASLAGVSTPADGVGELTAERRMTIGDYLLGQQTAVAERLQTRAFLDDSPAARAWANALSAELAPLASSPLPAIPTGSATPQQANVDNGSAPAPAPATAAPSADAPAGPRARSLPASRIGGALLLAAIAGAVVAATLLTANSGSGPHTTTSSNGSSSNAPAAKGKAATSSSHSTSRTSTTSGGPIESGRLALTSPISGSKTVGVVVLLTEGTQHAFYMAAEHLAPTKGFFYAVWLYNSPTSYAAVGKSPPVGSNGRMQGGTLLPANASHYRRLIVTHETSQRPSHPGHIVLSGPFKLAR
jgi:Sigma-70, region 4